MDLKKCPFPVRKQQLHLLFYCYLPVYRFDCRFERLSNTNFLIIGGRALATSLLCTQMLDHAREAEPVIERILEVQSLIFYVNRYVNGSAGGQSHVKPSI